MSQTKCEASIEFFATSKRSQWRSMGQFDTAKFQCCKEKGHGGVHRSYGSICEGNLVTDYSLEWENPKVRKNSEEAPA